MTNNSSPWQEAAEHNRENNWWSWATANSTGTAVFKTKPWNISILRLPIVNKYDKLAGQAAVENIRGLDPGYSQPPHASRLLWLSPQSGCKHFLGWLGILNQRGTIYLYTFFFHSQRSVNMSSIYSGGGAQQVTTASYLSTAPLFCTREAPCSRFQRPSVLEECLSHRTLKPNSLTLAHIRTWGESVNEFGELIDMVWKVGGGWICCLHDCCLPPRQSSNEESYSANDSSSGQNHPPCAKSSIHFLRR